MADNGNGWTEYQRLVLSELERHSQALHQIEMNLKKIDVDLATLKVKAGLWGLMGGLIPVAIAVFIELLFKR